MPKNSILAVLVAAIVMFAAGWFAGRWALEREWANPVRSTPGADSQTHRGQRDAPRPAEGTRIVDWLPLRGMREYLKGVTAKDPVVMKVGSWARDDDDKNVNLGLSNRGDCKAT